MADGDTATTRKVESGCELSFTRELQVLDDADYDRIQDFTSLTGLLEAIELRISRFEVIDATTERVLDPQSRILSATLSVNERVVADKATLTSLPKTVRIEGPALESVKRAVSRRQPVTLRVRTRVVMPDSPPLPRALRFEYEAQPTLVLGGAL